MIPQKKKLEFVDLTSGPTSELISCEKIASKNDFNSVLIDRASVGFEIAKKEAIFAAKIFS